MDILRVLLNQLSRRDLVQQSTNCRAGFGGTPTADSRFAFQPCTLAIKKIYSFIKQSNNEHLCHSNLHHQRRENRN